MRVTGPTFEDLAIDDSLPDVDRIEKYAHSSIALQRCACSGHACNGTPAAVPDPALRAD